MSVIVMSSIAWRATGHTQRLNSQPEPNNRLLTVITITGGHGTQYLPPRLSIFPPREADFTLTERRMQPVS